MDAHKDPTDRAHLWDRPTPDHDQPAVAPDPYFPRHLHKPGGVFKVVDDQAAMEAALADGWDLEPSPLPPAPDVAEPPPAAEVPVPDMSGE